MGVTMRYIYLFLWLMMAMLGLNIFLAVRDSKLVDDMKTRKEMYCEQVKEWHPDCKVE